MSEIHQEVAKLAENVAKLTLEVTRLRRDIAGLHSRIEPFEGEVPAAMPWHEEPQSTKPRRLVDELNSLRKARQAIESCEFHLAAMRGKVDEIANDSISRDEMKPWLKPPQGRTK